MASLVIQCRGRVLDFDFLQLPVVDLSSTDRCFSKDEVWSAICSMPTDKAPVPDDFTCQFYRMAWPLIKEDIMCSFHALRALDFRSFYLVNQSYTILLRKRATTEEIKDYRRISLLHSFNKLVTKVLSLGWPRSCLSWCSRTKALSLRGGQSMTTSDRCNPQ
jgi:hypothetical protein